MTDTGITSTGLCSTHSAYLRPSIARRWGCAAHTRSRPNLGGTGTLPPPIWQTCRVSARSGLHSLQAASSRHVEVSGHSTNPPDDCCFCSESQLMPGQSQEQHVTETQRQNQYQQRQQLGSGAVRTVAAIAAVASCLHAAPALADSAVQGAEQIAKSLSSSDGAMGRLQMSASCITATCLSVSHLCYLAAGSLGTEPFREGLVSGFLLILFSELGDKTFFIAVLLALKKNKGLVFAGTFGALAVMTVISVRPSTFCCQHTL